MSACAVCDARRSVEVGVGVRAVTPRRPVSRFDLWLAPHEHAEQLQDLSDDTLARWFTSSCEVFRRWRAHARVDGGHVLAFTGHHDDWPRHLSLRLVGRMHGELANPMRALNLGQAVDVDDELSGLGPVAPGAAMDPWRWNLDPAAQSASCLSCSPARIEEFEVASSEQARLFQHGAAIAPGLLLASPTRHVERFEDLRPEEFAALVRLVDAVDGHFATSVSASGTYLALNDGPVAGQETPHVHVHLWARSATDDPNPFAAGLPAAMGRPTEAQQRQLRDDAKQAFAKSAWSSGRTHGFSERPPAG